jgi:predicted nuclease of predicted toxin-antitoxin system
MPRKIRFYLDEHVPRAVVQGLRERGVDIKTVVEAGLLSASDDTHVQQARAERRVIFTQDSDFLRLHAAGDPHCGIV